MKTIFTLILIAIVGCFAYNTYADYQRFKPVNTHYVTPKNIDLNYQDKEVSMKYFEAIERLNTHIQSQWSVHQIDVRNPEKDNPQTQQALATLSQLKGKINYYENILKTAYSLKNEGLTPLEITTLINAGYSHASDQNKIANHKQKVILTTYITNAPQEISNDKVLVFEAQKMLSTQGYNLLVDGVNATATQEAIKLFEIKHNLLPDGILDKLTLLTLVEHTY